MISTLFSGVGVFLAAAQEGMVLQEGLDTGLDMGLDDSEMRRFGWGGPPSGNGFNPKSQCKEKSGVNHGICSVKDEGTSSQIDCRNACSNDMSCEGYQWDSQNHHCLLVQPGCNWANYESGPSGTYLLESKGCSYKYGMFGRRLDAGMDNVVRRLGGDSAMRRMPGAGNDPRNQCTMKENVNSYVCNFENKGKLSENDCKSACRSDFNCVAIRYNQNVGCDLIKDPCDISDYDRAPAGMWSLVTKGCFRFGILG